MEGRKVSESRVIMAHLMLPEDTNPAGHIHGGVILKYIDTTGGVAAMRHSRGNAVTASISRVDFIRPVHVGELVTFKASVNFVGRTSMEVGVRAEGENLFTGEVRHAASAYLTYVALDEHGKSRPVPPLIPENELDGRRMREAEIRRQVCFAGKALES